VNEICWVTQRESGVLIRGSEVTSYCLRQNKILESNQGQQLMLTCQLQRGTSSSHEGCSWRLTKQKENQSARNLQGKGGGEGV
jgi:hypothetical protein